ncbi:30S ribosomal protein S27ae [Candidatus Micrarchaeota archaeon CG08_land_8_20_14_0_20_49_17]|nr:MAG: hypothetical protein AUJ13_01805 [Candidatus Micrarchaeota archaeon CG1_02_49_24]PIU10011.1 MAG: 30S ribosomal protein S27ae [Candidatus Micrarchaeota archaeon CG08_land_8_20_14_0_20_49_17]PIU81969.1 MAG: 30S ribosomal protein S27ae [Candidatus Micrarchaeota archaeon CG06_land_8_20_14_3_00_50_6]PIZ99366.1 MAG: 30S ribosomal protein S27ae [Candidatus Micrarchaeota archaeon CG_4_10_14_0_2_um_filter_49_7]HII53634.1 30S ribosomal protein S27ae [Candidatus Micrarchaeota archaeon]
MADNKPQPAKNQAASESHAPKGASKKVREYKYKQGRSCPKCGPGVMLAEHKDRFSCGKCGYYERKK